MESLYASKNENGKVAPKKRMEVYKNFKKYVQHKDTRSMDDICMSGTTEFQKQVSTPESAKVFSRIYDSVSKLG